LHGAAEALASDLRPAQACASSKSILLKQPMKIRFEVDLAECLRCGVDCTKSPATLEIAPAALPQEVREAIAVRLHNGVVHCLALDSNIRSGSPGPNGEPLFVHPPFRKVIGHRRMIAKGPTLEALIQAVRDDDLRLEELIEAGGLVEWRKAGERLRPKKSPKQR